MKRRSPLIGFTEAELGFVIAAVVSLAATAPATPAEPPPTPPPQESPTPGDTASAALTDSGRGKTPSRADSTTRNPTAGKRDELPYCRQLGLPDTPIGDISILDTATFVVAGDTLGHDGLQALLAPAVAESSRQQCKFKLYFRIVGEPPYRWVRKAKAPYAVRFVTSDRY